VNGPDQRQELQTLAARRRRALNGTLCGDSAEMLRRCAARTRRHVKHWTGHKSRDLVRSIPNATDAIVVVLDQVSHALANKVRRDASRLIS